jgi:pimeloyl-ACP methyl ester carboxylesterase
VSRPSLSKRAQARRDSNNTAAIVSVIMLITLTVFAPILETPGGAASAATTGVPNRLSWRRCPGEPTFDCATLQVPINHARPTGPTISLAVRKLRARTPKRKIGTLVVNPGGPGGSGVEFLRRANGAFGTKLRDRFDLLSWDPRGVGLSAPVRCSADVAGLERYLRLDPEPDDQGEVEKFSTTTDTFTAGCLKASGPELLGNVDTESTVRDLELIRQALGEQLTYMGFSYGTLIGAIYADLFPGKVRAMVLDGALDPSMGMDDRSRQQTIGFQQSIELWSKSCMAENACAVALGPRPAVWVDQFLDRIDQLPIAVGKRNLDLAAALYGVVAGMYSATTGWPALRSALVAASKGNGSELLRLADGYNDRRQDGSYANTIEANVAVNCIDGAADSDTKHYIALSSEFERLSPVFGEAIAWSGLACGRWPIKAKNVLRPRRATGSAPLMVIGTTNDPATPLIWAKTMATTFDNGVLIEHEGTGHTAYLRGGKCVRRIVESYLVDNNVPPATVKVNGDASCALSGTGNWES